MDSAAPPISVSEGGEYATQLNGKDLIVHLNPASSGFKDVDIVKTKESTSRFLRFSRANPSTDARSSEDDDADRRMLCASDTRILVWQLHPLQQCAEIENLELGATSIDFGGDQNEVIVFHAWNTKLTVFSLDTGRSQVIKTPKSSHSNSFGYRPKTRQLAILLKPDTSDLLTIHESRSYELINRAVLPTLDAQGLKWSPDGRWIAVWDTASTGTKVLIFTADGQLFRSYTGPPDSDTAFDLGVKGVEWGPAGDTGTSELLAVGKVDGNVDILKSKTFTCSASLSHIFQIDQCSPGFWRERYTTNGELEYAESSSSSAFSIVEASGPPRGISIMAFSSDAGLLGTVDQSRPTVVWIWALEEAPRFVSALVHEHPIRQILWHPSNTELLITTTNNAVAAVRHWSPSSEPVVTRIPISRSESGRYDAKWLSSHDCPSRFWFGTSDEYVVGYLANNGTRFEVLNSINRA